MDDLDAARALRAAGRHEEARARLLALAARFPNAAEIQYETAAVHDVLGLEREAVPFYRAAIQGGLSEDQLRGAYLGLGSTYRALGMYEESRQVLEEGLQRLPEANELRVFLAMTHYNLHQNHRAMSALLNVIAATTDDPAIRRYSRAIHLYAGDLDRVWE